MNLTGAPADPSCLCDFLKAESFYEATQDVPGMWEDPPAPRAVQWSGVRMAMLEQLFARHRPHRTAVP